MESERKDNRTFTINLPAYKKAKLELWRHIDPNNMETLLRCFEIDHYDEFLKRLDEANVKLDYNPDRYSLFSRQIAQLLNLSLEDPRHAILIDQYYYLIEFALTNKFNKEQINILLSIAIRVHDLAVDSSFGNLDQTIDFFKQSLLVYAVYRPPFSLSFFTPHQIELVVNYFLDTYFNQFKFYKYVFTPAVRLNLKLDYPNLQVLEQATVNQIGDDDDYLDKEIEYAESMANEDQRGLDSRQTGEDEKGFQELREFVKKYLSQQVDKTKKEILIENEMAIREQATKSAARGSAKNKSAKKK